MKLWTNVSQNKLEIFQYEVVFMSLFSDVQ